MFSAKTRSIAIVLVASASYGVASVAPAVSQALGVSLGCPSCAPVGEVRLFSTLFTEKQPHAIAEGPDGNMWFTMPSAHRVGRLNPTTGAVTEFSKGITGNPYGIAEGKDGNMWFTEFEGDRIGRITPSGEVTEYTETIHLGSYPDGITEGPDGNMWFTEPDANRVGRINPATGEVKQYEGLTILSKPLGIAADSDGNLWFTEHDGKRIGRLNPTTGKVTEFSKGISADSLPFDIAAGPDGNMWFTEERGGIGRLNPKTGEIKEFREGITGLPTGIAAGPDGNLWFGEMWANAKNVFQPRIGRITPAGKVTEFSKGFGEEEPSELWTIAPGPGEKMWFTGTKVGWIRAKPGPPVASDG